MNWENSKALTLLKKDFLKEFFEVEKRFFLTGGSALGIFYLEHRYSYDLDFFTCQKDINWKEIEATLNIICNNINAKYCVIRRSPSFQRFQIKRNTEVEIIDFVIEWVEQIDKQKNNISNMIIDTVNEIGINKICTLLSRSELKDIVDLYFLEKIGFDIIDNLDKAKEKDAGIDPGMLSYLLNNINVTEIPDYMIKALSVKELALFISKLKHELSAKAYPK